jgi:uncharacterized protein (TIGR02145 family)
VQAQVLKVWKNDSVTNISELIGIDSITFKADGLEIIKKSGVTSYSLIRDLDSITFVGRVILNKQNCKYDDEMNELDCPEKVYKTVVIGNQIWMAENLNYGSYISDGDTSSTYQSGAEKFCFGNEPGGCDLWGAMYQWHTAMDFEKVCNTIECASKITKDDHQGICPIGWHIPKKSEWVTLQNHLGGVNVAGKKMKINNSGFPEWDSPSTNDGNSSGFSAYPTGYRYRHGGFIRNGERAQFWAATEKSWETSENINLQRGYTFLGNALYGIKKNGFSVRCVKD